MADSRPNHQSAEPAPLPISEAELLARLFPKRLVDASKCPQRAADSSLESERALGLVVPHVAATAAGSFTAPNQRETTVLVDVGECRPYGFEAGGSRELIVLDGARVVWASEKSDADELSEGDLEGVHDIDGDGVDEIVLMGTTMHAGHVRTQARIVSIASGSIRDVFPRTEVFEDDCPSEEPGATQRAGWIEITRGKSPNFVVRWTNRVPCLLP